MVRGQNGHPGAVVNRIVGIQGTEPALIHQQCSEELIVVQQWRKKTQQICAMVIIVVQVQNLYI